MWNWLLTTKQHAMIDYAWSLALPAIPRFFGWSCRSTHVCDTVAAAGAIQTTLTDFEGGVKGVIPMQCHLAGDTILGVGLMLAATVMEDEPAEERLGLACLGLLACFTAATTEPIPRGRGRERAKRMAKAMRNAIGEDVSRYAGANPKRKRSTAATAAR